MSARELSAYTAVAKYARYIEEEKRRETWKETVDRSRHMMLERFPSLSGEINHAYDMVLRMEVLGSQRVLQFAGPPMLKRHAKGYNCAASYCDRLGFFQECFYLLLCGTGTGFSVQDHHVKCLPNFTQARLSGVQLPRKVFRPSDDVEGWGDCVGVLLSSYHYDPPFEEYADCEVEFDLSPIRPKGALLSYGMGLAPGPDGLANALAKIRAVLDNCLRLGLRKLRSIDAFDIVMHFADAVLSGAQRRSATLALFSPWDKLMREAKVGNWYDTNPQRARANISAALHREHAKYEDYAGLFECTRQFGEPGINWQSVWDYVCNPCAEASFVTRLLLKMDDPTLLRLLPKYRGPIQGVNYSSPDHYPEGYAGLSCWNFCNLSTISAKSVRSKEDFFERAKWAAFLGVLQKSFTSFPYLGEISELLTRREGLLGVSISGMQHHPKITFDPDVQKEAAAIVLRTDEEYSRKLGLSPAARSTVIKPDGNSSSLLAGEPGIIPGHSRRYFRCVQANRQEAPYQLFKKNNPQACEPSKWSANGTDDVIRFCLENTNGTRLKKDVSGLEMLEMVKTTYNNWVLPGKRPERCVSPLISHSVSNTVMVRPDEWEDVREWCWANKEYVGGISFIADGGDKDFAQAPYTSVHTPEEQKELYGAEAVEEADAILKDADLKGFKDLWDACSLPMGWWGHDRKPTEGQKRWAEKVGVYAKKNFLGDIRKATHAIKDKFLWEHYCHLKGTYKEVDYSTMVEERASVNHTGELTCVGGACLI